MSLIMQYWNKTHIVAKFILLIVVAVLIHMMFFRQTYAENFGNPTSCTYYYMTNCGHCKSFTPEWDSFVAEYNGPVKMKKVEMNDAGSDLQKYKIDGFPTVLIIDENGDTETYDGPRTSAGLKSYFSS